MEDKHIRYHRALGVGAFGTVSGCIVAPVGCMLANKTMNRKRIKAKHARQQVVAEHIALVALATHPSPFCAPVCSIAPDAPPAHSSPTATRPHRRPTLTRSAAGEGARRAAFAPH